MLRIIQKAIIDKRSWNSIYWKIRNEVVLDFCDKVPAIGSNLKPLLQKINLGITDQNKNERWLLWSSWNLLNSF